MSSHKNIYDEIYDEENDFMNDENEKRMMRDYLKKHGGQVMQEDGTASAFGLVNEAEVKIRKKDLR